MNKNFNDDLDNLVNFVKRAPVKLRKIWKENYMIDEKELTTKVDIDYQRDREMTAKELKKIIRDIVV